MLKQHSLIEFVLNLNTFCYGKYCIVNHSSPSIDLDIFNNISCRLFSCSMFMAIDKKLACDMYTDFCMTLN